MNAKAEQPVEYSPRAKAQISAYLNSIEDPIIGIAAAEELRRELYKLARDPKLGSAPTGPFEKRPFYPFILEASGTKRLAHISYRESPRGKGKIDVFEFLAVAI